MATRRSITPVLFVLISLLVPAAARADDDEDPTHAEAPADRRDLSPHEHWDGTADVAGGPGNGPWVAIEGGLALRSRGERELGAMLLIGVPLDRWARRTSTRDRRSVATDRAASEAAQPRDEPAALERPDASTGAPARRDAPDRGDVPSRALLGQAEAPRPRLKPLRRSARQAEPQADAEAAPPAGDPPRPEAIEVPLPRPVVVTPAVARAAVREALRHARLLDADARLDAIASRARSSALLPELRLRATRLVDEAESLSPTEYDPARTTATGGVSLWIEARATWRLDRLVFADEEVPLERIRHDRADAEGRVTARVLELLFAWQRASAAEADAGRTPEEHLDAALRVLESEAALDVATGGWFSRWRGRRDD